MQQLVTTALSASTTLFPFSSMAENEWLRQLRVAPDVLAVGDLDWGYDRVMFVLALQHMEPA